MRLDDGWNQIQFNLADFTRRAYGTNYVVSTYFCFELHVPSLFLLGNFAGANSRQLPNSSGVLLRPAVFRGRITGGIQTVLACPTETGPTTWRHCCTPASPKAWIDWGTWNASGKRGSLNGWCIFSTIFSLYSYSSWTAPNLCVTPIKQKIYTQLSAFIMDHKPFFHFILDKKGVVSYHGFAYIICSDFSCFEWMNQFLFGGNRKLFWDYWETQVRALDYSCVYEPNVWTFPH